MNELINANSPYLLQHSENPVHWKMWRTEVLEEAKKSDKLLIISIGYAACHWCHVMEKECFENDDVASVMNTDYISIKIDREEQPEVDAIYMKALQIMTGQGGWPLNIVALPDGRPVWGATYVNKRQWTEVLTQLQQLYKSDTAKMYEYADRLHEGMKVLGNVNAHVEPDLSFSIEQLVSKWQRSFDLEYGGYARSPKFMMPTNLDFLQAYGTLTNNNELLNHIDTTLTRMAWGGLFDTLHGGFSRYSVDEKWHIPHFEKMLYDNAQLLKTYADAYKRTNYPLYKQVLQKTISFITDEFQDSSGGFYSALDADSLDKKNILKEGAYYTWRKDALKDLLKEDFELFSKVYNINEFGHWEDGEYVLIQNKPLKDLAQHYSIPVEELEIKKRKWEQKLFSERKKRAYPRLDDKILTSWNALLLSGMIHANSVLKNEAIEKTIFKLEHFIHNVLTNENFELGHAYKNNKVYIDGLMEDYAFVIQANIDLYSYYGKEEYLLNAKKFSNIAFDLFYDESQNCFRAHQKNPALIMDHFDIEDNVIPASNSIMTNNLLLLNSIDYNPHYHKSALKMLENIIHTIDYASAFSHWLLAYLKTKDTFKMITVGSNLYKKNMETLRNKYLPNTLLLYKELENSPKIEVCSSNKCILLNDFNELLDMISIK
ncbi:thioredoxin domain-containing protein [Myroides ceti]|uniref:Thioredoxin domain-containing protein n=1 Tax=Paenimyroides ceti TaxID=395087 RepID=A0ABT8CU95_9FLAO|nr:thioredoxin domain-containing protein [Paenimyroides ceti]MDN3708079.1 thioredoxin domain-containing protein [Paenimyroides ceti]